MSDSGECEVEVGQRVKFWSWRGLARVQRAGVVERIIWGCAGYLLRLQDGRHVPTSCLVRARQLSLFGDV
ncbi:MAG: hypothetical protein RBU37_26745 [Myxococcota bacterium]|nr:hypothetical protein [Myxococcota bacterium]